MFAYKDIVNQTILVYNINIVGANGGEGPPVPIPNTEVKLISAENTWLEAARENRAVPTHKRSTFNQNVLLLLYIIIKKIGKM